MNKQLFTEYPEPDERKYYDLLIGQVKKRMDFFIKTIKNYYGFFSAIATWEPSALLWLFAHPKQLSALKAITSRNPKSLLLVYQEPTGNEVF